MDRRSVPRDTPLGGESRSCPTEAMHPEGGSMSRLVQRLALAALTAACLALPAQARAPRQVTRPAKSASTSSAAVPSFWQFLRTLWGANGSSLDPNGKPSTEGSGVITPPPATPNGSSLDPNG